MKIGSLDLSGKIDPPIVEIFEGVSTACLQLKLPYIVVGATARDLVMHHGYGAEVVRATKDVDLAINVPRWDAFERLKATLLTFDFRETASPHRLVSPSKMLVDLVPFGGVEEDKSVVVWPPDRTTAMSVLGFREAYDHAIKVHLGTYSNLTIPVVSPSGLALLKIIAWTDRDPLNRSRDAQDLSYLLRSYEEIPSISTQLYDDAEILESYDWDLTVAAAYLLGREAGQIARPESRFVVEQFFAVNEFPGNSETLIFEMGGNAQFDRNTNLWTAFLEGFCHQ